MVQLIGIMGGTFDPIHKGHLFLIEALLKKFKFESVRLIPCKLPVHKKPAQATAKQRVAMLQLAIKHLSRVYIDLREIQRQSPSYMIETLQSLRQDYPMSALALIIGSDSFNHLSSWYDYENLLNFAHLIVVTRPGYPIIWEEALKKVYENNVSTELCALRNSLNGKICFCEIDALNISSTQIKTDVQAGLSSLPESIRSYVIKNAIYLNYQK